MSYLSTFDTLDQSEEMDKAMKDSLHQVGFSYVPEEDRILFRISTQSGVGCRFWLTRRYVQLIWQAMETGIVHQPELAQQSIPEAKTALRDLQQQKIVQEGDFSSPYEEEALAFPMGDQPLLLTGLQAQIRDGGGLILELCDRSNRSVSLDLDTSLLYSCRHLLQQALISAEWALLGGDSENGSIKLKPDAQFH